MEEEQLTSQSSGILVKLGSEEETRFLLLNWHWSPQQQGKQWQELIAQLLGDPLAQTYEGRVQIHGALDILLQNEKVLQDYFSQIEHLPWKEENPRRARYLLRVQQTNFTRALEVKHVEWLRKKFNIQLSKAHRQVMRVTSPRPEVLLVSLVALSPRSEKKNITSVSPLIDRFANKDLVILKNFPINSTIRIVVVFMETSASAVAGKQDLLIQKNGKKVMNN